MPDTLDANGFPVIDQPLVAPPAISVPAPVSPVAAPQSVSVAPPGAVAATPYSLQLARQAQAAKAMLPYANMPMAQAETAIEQSLKFQAMSGYQRDLASGMDTAEALAKWAPMMFVGPKSSLGQSASFLRAVRPAPVRPTNVGGVAYLFDQKTQSMKPLTPQKPAAPSRFDTMEYQQVLRDMSATQKELDANPTGQEADDNRQKLSYLRSRLQQIRGGTPTPTPAAAPAAKTVVRKTADGRRAVFDANTRKFLRYADAND